jgi:hypothetical protein
MKRLVLALASAVIALTASVLSANAAVVVSCPLLQATRTIVNPLPPGWSTSSQINPVTNYRVDTSSGQQVLVCEYGASGSVQRPAPVNQNCTKIAGRKFSCVPAPPPGPVITVVSDGPLTLSDGGSIDLDDGGAQDLRLRADNPFLRTLEPRNGAQLSQQGTQLPSYNTCKTAAMSPAPIPQVQVPVGVWLCVTTSDGNVGRFRIANINGMPGLPLPMTLYLDHTTWQATSGGGGGGGGQPLHSSATVSLQQTFSLDLDEGIAGGGPQADVWFQAVTAAQLYLKPMNGAQFAVGNRSDRGYDGCAAEAFSPSAVPLLSLTPGSFVCAATNQGRVTQFRVNSVSAGFPKTISLTYTTWE